MSSSSTPETSTTPSPDGLVLEMRVCGITARQIARRTGRPYDRVRRVLAGDLRARDGELEAIAAALKALTNSTAGLP